MNPVGGVVSTIKRQSDAANEIHQLFIDNEINDLKRFFAKREKINGVNSWLIYFFHFFQSVGILTTTIATGYNNVQLIWIGIGLNCLASLINVYEKTNATVSNQLMGDINAIKIGKYADESLLTYDIGDDGNYPPPIQQPQQQQQQQQQQQHQQPQQQQPQKQQQQQQQQQKQQQQKQQPQQQQQQPQQQQPQQQQPQQQQPQQQPQQPQQQPQQPQQQQQQPQQQQQQQKIGIDSVEMV